MPKLKLENWKSTSPYVDTGCADAGVRSCLVCPLPKCVEDMTREELAALRRDRLHRDVVESVRVLGLTLDEAAMKFSLTKRSVFRILARYPGQSPPSLNSISSLTTIF